MKSVKSDSQGKYQIAGVAPSQRIAEARGTPSERRLSAKVPDSATRFLSPRSRRRNFELAAADDQPDRPRVACAGDDAIRRWLRAANRQGRHRVEHIHLFQRHACIAFAQHQCTAAGRQSASLRHVQQPLPLRPYNVTTGTDLNGDGLYTDRPAFVTSASQSIVRTPYGNFDVAPAPGAPIIPRNYLQGPGLVAVNLRVAKIFTLGERKPKSGDPKQITLMGQCAQCAQSSQLRVSGWQFELAAVLWTLEFAGERSRIVEQPAAGLANSL